MTALAARTRPSALAQWWWSVDRTALAAVFALIAAGLLLSLAASPAAAERIGADHPFHYLTRHGVFAALGAFAVLFASALSPLGARRLAGAMLAAGLAGLVLTVVIGHEAGGAQRWLRVGGLSAQPSEFVKPALIVIAAALFARARDAGAGPAWVAAGLFGLVIALFALQPDIGQAALLTAAFGALAFISGLKLRWLAGLGALAAAGAVAAYVFLPHVASRVDRFLNPQTGDTYQVDRAREAIMRGGLFGVGPGEGAVKRQLPDAHTDFIFAVAAEEYGAVFAAGLAALFAVFALRILLRAQRVLDPAARYAACGLAALIGLQAVINIAMALNLAPPKGMTLPFVSYGGSSMAASGLAAGLALAFTRRRPGAYAAGPAGDARER